MSNDNPSLTPAIDGLSQSISATLSLGRRPGSYCTEAWLGLIAGPNGCGKPRSIALSKSLYQQRHPPGIHHRHHHHHYHVQEELGVFPVP